MQPATLISVPEYLATTFRPDRDLIGRLVERNFGEYDHANLQGALIHWFYIHQREWNIHVLPEQRVQVKHDRFRIPDLCIEILSKDDTLRGMQERIDDYLNFGVTDIWLLEPATRRAYICDRIGLREPASATLEIPATPLSISLPALFAELD